MLQTRPLHASACPLRTAEARQRRACLRSARQMQRVGAPCRKHLRRTKCSSETESEAGPAERQQTNIDVGSASRSLDKEFAKFARGTATTFAPRASGPSKNPAFKGSTLYTVFEVQAWLSLAVGGLLSFNVIFPTDKPSIARLLGMWSIWMLTVPSLRARDCSSSEKDALNVLFILIPVINVLLPFVWKSFPFIYSADVVALAAVYAWKLGLPKLGNN